MDDLFAGTENASAPLAERMRPASLADFVGQRHLLASDKPLGRVLETGRLHSIILWGPPGVGKTSLARLIAGALDYRFEALSAVMSGVKELRAAVQQAQIGQDQGRRTILFIDEIHRFNKAQQDALLPFVESGLFTFIGATTENPAFEVNSALLSRAQVYVLQALSNSELTQLLQRGLQKSEDLPSLTESAQDLLVRTADGDGRRLFNLLEQLRGEEASHGSSGPLDGDVLSERLPTMLRRFDKGGDAFYDQISALHKSVRGSDPDAALYWFCRMLDGGADPRYLSRRILRMAWEDIGLADPRAAALCESAASTYERLGSPEGELALAQAVIYLAVAAKSNAGYSAFKLAQATVRNQDSAPVPMHLRNAPTRLAKNHGHGEGYRYAHDEQDGYAAGEHYLPDGMENPGWYQPVNRGLEQKIGEKLKRLREMDAEALARQSRD